MNETKPGIAALDSVSEMCAVQMELLDGLAGMIDETEANCRPFSHAPTEDDSAIRPGNVHSTVPVIRAMINVGDRIDLLSRRLEGINARFSMRADVELASDVPTCVDERHLPADRMRVVPCVDSGHKR